MKQELVEIGDVLVPVIIDEGDIWYPIVYLSEKVLMRTASILPSGTKKNNYISYVKSFDINYSLNGGGIQHTKCISQKGLKLFLANSRVGRLSVDQRYKLNVLNEFLDIDKISEDERFIDYAPHDMINKYSLFIKDAIDDVLKIDHKITWQRCSKCNNYYPYHLNFFKENQSSPDGIDTYCRTCKSWDENRRKVNMIKREDNEWNLLVRKYGEDIYEHCRNGDIINLYFAFINSEHSHMPELLYSKESYLKIIKHLYDDGLIRDDQLILQQLYEQFRLNNIHKILTLNEIFEYLFGSKYYITPWKYENFNYIKIHMSIKDCKESVMIYLKEHEDEGVIEDLFTFEYIQFFKDIKIYKFIKHDLLNFVTSLFDYIYPGYKFKSMWSYKTQYYNSKEHRIRDLKFLIEKELEIPLDKIPLYLTNYSLQKMDVGMYNVLRRHYNNLFEWVNECYPNKYIEADFVINPYRNEFDSNEEAQIHDIIKEYTNNFLYNPRNTDRTIKIKDMIPDWILFTDHGCYLVEYYGMYRPEQKDNSRVAAYIKKYNKKMDMYNKINEYEKLFIYPDDLKNNFERLREKIKSIL